MGLLNNGGWFGLLGGVADGVSRGMDQKRMLDMLQIDRQRGQQREDWQFGQAKTEAERKARADLQQQNLDSLLMQYSKPGAKPATMDNRDVGQPGEAAIPRQQVDLPGLAQAYMGAPGGLEKGLHLMQAQQKDTTPIVVPDGGILAGRDGKTLLENPKTAPDKTPEALRALEQVYGKGSPEYTAAARKYADKLTTHQPGTNVTVNAEKPLVNELAGGLGKQIDASLAGANSARQAVTSAQRIRELATSGNVVTGPGADWRTTALRIGSTLGVAGANDQEKLANTSELMRNLAQGELDAAGQMKGQGQITEAERAILKKAASGDLNMTPGELVRLSQTVEKTARGRISQHQATVKKLGSVRGAEALMPFYDVEQPGGGAPARPAGAGARPVGGLSAAEQTELEQLRRQLGR